MPDRETEQARGKVGLAHVAAPAFDQRLDATKAGAGRHHARTDADGLGPFGSPVHLEGDHGAEPAHLAGRQS